MIALQIEFLAGRFHANPWDRGTNEGEVEWPPAPWRLLRAITAGWFKAGAPERDQLLNVLDALTDPPTFYLPAASTGHTRHYTPQASGAKVLVLDSFLRLADNEQNVATAFVVWPNVSLSAANLNLLKTCTQQIGYLGRAESWCAITVQTEFQTPDRNSELQLVALASRSKDNGPTVRRLAAKSSYRGEGLFASICESTAAMRKTRRLMPTGAEWVEYRLPPDFLQVREQAALRENKKNAFEGSVIFRFAIERNGTGPGALITDAVVFGELMRCAAIKSLTALTSEPATKRMAGKTEDGAPGEGHGHPYFIPCDAVGKGQITNLDIWFPKGCTHDEYRAVSGITSLFEGSLYADRFTVTFLGTDEAPTARTWATATPIVLERFPRAARRKGLEAADHPYNQLKTAFERKWPDQVEKIEIWEPAHGIPRRGAADIRVQAFRKNRLRKTEPTPPAVGVTVTFKKPEKGPILLGRLAHFGLGHFEPARTEA